MERPYSLRLLKGKEIVRHLPDVADLRLRVFKEYPYLFQDDDKHTLTYLSHYAAAKHCLLVTATSNNEMVGAVAGIPLEATSPATQKPFIDTHQTLSQWFYIDEIVVAPQWRTRGLGGLFLRAMEDHAKELGYLYTTFCVIHRPATHPSRPRGYVPPDEYFIERGYERLPELNLHLTWVDTGEGRATTKTMKFWYKKLNKDN